VTRGHERRWAKSFPQALAILIRINKKMSRSRQQELVSKKKKMDDVAGLWDEGRAKILRAWISFE
jgi:hypothetical protein